MGAAPPVPQGAPQDDFGDFRVTAEAGGGQIVQQAGPDGARDGGGLLLQHRVVSYDAYHPLRYAGEERWRPPERAVHPHKVRRRPDVVREGADGRLRQSQLGAV